MPSPPEPSGASLRRRCAVGGRSLRPCPREPRRRWSEGPLGPRGGNLTGSFEEGRSGGRLRRPFGHGEERAGCLPGSPPPSPLCGRRAWAVGAKAGAVLHEGWGLCPVKAFAYKRPMSRLGCGRPRTALAFRVLCVRSLRVGSYLAQPAFAWIQPRCVPESPARRLRRDVPFRGVWGGMKVTLPEGFVPPGFLCRSGAAFNSYSNV